MSVGVKIPATDTASFGTGEWDFGGTVGVSRLLGNAMLLSADLSYWHLGDPPELEVTDPLMASVGVAYLSLSGWAASLAFSGARSIIEGFSDAYFLNGGLTRVWSRSAVGVSTSVGFTESTPDFTLGVNWRVRLTSN